MVIAPGLIRNQQVAGSNPAGGSRKSDKINNLGRWLIRWIGHRHSVSPLCHHQGNYSERFIGDSPFS
jgi:hypothetical protein